MTHTGRSIGTISTWIRVVGPLTRGRYLEIEVIPDVRLQCAALATTPLPQVPYGVCNSGIIIAKMAELFSKTGEILAISAA